MSASPTSSRFFLPEDPFEVLRRRLSPPHDPVIDPGELRYAAVLALIREATDTSEPSLVLIERSDELPSHGGQLAFPGGKPEPRDRHLLDTAVREAQEEVGLDPALIEVLGRLDPVPTPTGFMILPFVAKVRPHWSPQILSPEVKRILEPPLRVLVGPGIYRMSGRVTWRGRSYDMHEFAIHEPPLWGATARMVWDLLVRLKETPPTR